MDNCNCKISHPLRIYGDGRRICVRCRKIRAYARPSMGHGMGFTISTRGHEVCLDRKREAKRQACRKTDPRKGGC